MIYLVSNQLPGTYTDLYTQQKSIPELNQKQILQIHMQRIDRANGINQKGLAVTWWNPNTVFVDQDLDKQQWLIGYIVIVDQICYSL